MKAQLHTTNSSDPLLLSAVHHPGARKRGDVGSVKEQSVHLGVEGAQDFLRFLILF